MDDYLFEKEVETVMTFIVDAIEKQDHDNLIDVEVGFHILKMNTEKGVFVINKQNYIKEIWLSSPISGPHHFIKEGLFWRNRNKVELYSILTKELKINFLF